MTEAKREVWVIETSDGYVRRACEQNDQASFFSNRGETVVRYVPESASQPAERDGQWASCVPRASVRWFAEQMELALRRNDHKRGWHECDPMALVRRVGQEQKELLEACGLRSAGLRLSRGRLPPHARILTPDEANIIKEAADVGAMAMMVAEHFRAGGPSLDQGQTLPAPPQPKETP